MIRHGGILTLCLLLHAAGCSGRAGEADKKPPAPHAKPSAGVTIGQTTWTAELATDPDSRYLGLSGRRSLAANYGMLFVYPTAAVRDFCMRKCYIDIDIAFIGPDRRVVKTYTMLAEPDMVGRVAYSSVLPAQYVFETSSGALARAGVREGDLVEFTGVDPAKALPDERR